ncbi:hypothetical protein GGX14DRAFT_575462 [Mycena pura]|uniref:Uncharacterized protein n=1 Tax=Mycena pura TaxID=153505 RepID=A0AAD6UVB1_9AGAR|nr:hypothetical protein GGX14DRAFT_575462 [Mycena pura]
MGTVTVCLGAACNRIDTAVTAYTASTAARRAPPALQRHLRRPDAETQRGARELVEAALYPSLNATRPLICWWRAASTSTRPRDTHRRRPARIRGPPGARCSLLAPTAISARPYSNSRHWRLSALPVPLTVSPSRWFKFFLSDTGAPLHTRHRRLSTLSGLLTTAALVFPITSDADADADPGAHLHPRYTGTGTGRRLSASVPRPWPCRSSPAKPRRGPQGGTADPAASLDPRRQADAAARAAATSPWCTRRPSLTAELKARRACACAASW